MDWLLDRIRRCATVVAASAISPPLPSSSLGMRNLDGWMTRRDGWMESFTMSFNICNQRRIFFKKNKQTNKLYEIQ
jgi:hypothetical protein